MCDSRKEKKRLHEKKSEKKNEKHAHKSHTHTHAHRDPTGSAATPAQFPLQRWLTKIKTHIITFQ